MITSGGGVSRRAGGDAGSQLEAAWDRLAFDLSPYGISSMFYGIVHVGSLFDPPEGLSRIAMWKTSYPESYLGFISHKGLLAEDYSVRRLFETGKPVLWSDATLFDQMRPEERRRWRRDDLLGFSTGVSIPVFAHGKRPCGGFGLCAGDTGPDAFEAIWTRNSQNMCALVTAFDRDYRLALAHLTFPLSPREQAVLSLAAGGLTSDQMAHRLALSRKTVEAYLNSARRKMHAPNTTAAAAKAIFFNLL